ncbi:MAG: phosphatidate cytidylyltransferase, partial [Gammaproteobacteria bacterium]|nr:phosphatidate cytidylyltransferase [Gammaproteobacteria bacterium]
MTAVDTGLYWVLAVLFSSLVVGSIARFIALRHADESKRQQRFASLRTWWMLAIAVSAALLSGRPGICLLLGLASCIAWFEITRMLDVRAADKVAVCAGYAIIVVNYLLILFGMASVFVIFLPLGSILVFAILLLIKDESQGYIRSAGSLIWGIMFLGYGVSHAAYLTILPETADGPLGPVGWVLFLVIITEADDIFQAIVGRLFGSHKRHRIAPMISPNKTWEGFFGGVLAIVILAPLIAPWLTTLDWQASVLAAILISVAGYFGDINMSA